MLFIFKTTLRVWISCFKNSCFECKFQKMTLTILLRLFYHFSCNQCFLQTHLLFNKKKLIPSNPNGFDQPHLFDFFFFFLNFTTSKETAATPNIQPKFYSNTISYLKFNEARKLCPPSLNTLP